MQGRDIGYTNSAIAAVLAANNHLLQMRLGAALLPAGGCFKEKYSHDTLGLDAIPEGSGAEVLVRYDSSAVIISEETGLRSDSRPVRGGSIFHHPSVYYVVDPTDRSKNLAQYFSAISNKTLPMASVVGTPKACRLWEETNSGPAIVTGACSSVACFVDGKPLCSAIINYITQHLFVACAAGIRMFKLGKGMDERSLTLERVLQDGKRIYFHPIQNSNVEHMLRFTTFLGKAGYKENFLLSGLMDETEMGRRLVYDLPGGPLRILYLSNLFTGSPPLGLIFANGEKFGEWAPWTAYVANATLPNDDDEVGLKLFEVFQDNSGNKQGVQMAPSPNYSLFRKASEQGEDFIIDPGILSRFDNPSQARATLLVTPRRNRAVRSLMESNGYRRILF